jgi:hypothetical protein
MVTDAQAIIRFLDRHATHPVARYEGLHERWGLGDGFTRACLLYGDEEVWLAWHDMLSQSAEEACECGGKGRDLLAAEPDESCVQDAATDVSLISNSSHEIRLGVCRLMGGPLVPGLVDPWIITEMRERYELSGKKLPSAPDIDYEKSGHQAAVDIKRVLERTANESGDMIIRMNTTWRNPALAESCKVAADASANKIAFRVSNGKETVKGYFTSIASSRGEQSTVLTYVERVFVRNCVRVGLSIQGS